MNNLLIIARRIYAEVTGNTDEADIDQAFEDPTVSDLYVRCAQAAIVPVEPLNEGAHCDFCDGYISGLIDVRDADIIPVDLSEDQLEGWEMAFDALRTVIDAEINAVPRNTTLETPLGGTVDYEADADEGETTPGVEALSALLSMLFGRQVRVSSAG